MRFYLLMLVPLLVGGCSSLKSMDPLEASWQVANGIDAIQSSHFRESSGCFEEGDPITSKVLGSRPSGDSILMWGVVTGATHYLVTKALKKRRKKLGRLYKPLRVLDFIVKLGVIRRNNNLGVKMRGVSQRALDLCHRRRSARIEF